MKMTERRDGNSRLRVVGGKITVECKAHKTMTPEEYASMPIVGWHAVCRNYDGFGGVGVRFMTDGMFADGEVK